MAIDIKFEMSWDCIALRYMEIIQRTLEFLGVY